MYACICVYTQARTQTQSHTHTRARARAHTHTHTHTHTPQVAEASGDARHDDMQELQKVSKEEIDALNERIVELQEEREASRTHRKQQIAVLGEQQEVLEADILSKDTELQKMREEIAGLEEEAGDLKRQQAKGSDTQRELEQQLQGAQASISSLTKELEEAKESAEAEAEKMREEIAGLEEEAGDLKRQQAKGSDTQRELEQQLQEAELERKASQESHERHLSELASRDTVIQDALDDLKEQSTALVLAQQAAHNAEEKLTAAESRVAVLEADLQGLSLELEQRAARSSVLLVML